MRQILEPSSTSLFLRKEIAGRRVGATRRACPVLISPHFRIGRSFSTLVAPTSSKKVLNTALKMHLARVDSVKYACLTMTNVDFRGGARHGGAGCWQHRIC